MEIKIDKDRTALLVMDLQNHVIHKDSPLAQHAGFAEMVEKKNLLPRIRKVMDAARAVDLLVVTVRNDITAGEFPRYPERGDFCRAIKAEHDAGEVFRPGVWGYEINELVAPKEGEPVVGKMHMSAFAGSRLDQVLRDHGITEIALTGVATSFVVSATTWVAIYKGIGCIIIEDCCVSGSEEMHQSAINALAPVTDMCSADEFIKAIQ
jgi:nicotinamidase-related amidase